MQNINCIASSIYSSSSLFENTKLKINSLTYTTTRAFSKREVDTWRYILLVLLAESLRIELVWIREVLRIVMQTKDWDENRSFSSTTSLFGIWYLVIVRRLMNATGGYSIKISDNTISRYGSSDDTIINRKQFVVSKFYYCTYRGGMHGPQHRLH